jgi:hypothetical protein
MINTKINIEDIYKKANFSLERIDRMRLEKLESVNSTQQVRKIAYEKEKKRLAAKYGPNHPRVKKLGTKLKFREGFIKSLDIEIDNASIEIPSFDINTWMVYGRVLNKSLKGIKGLTVSLYDKQGKLIEELGYDCTDERGFYSLIYSPEKIKKQQIKGDRELFLTVSDKQNHILHRESEPLLVNIGQIDTRMIIITDQDGTCTPPEPIPEESVVPQDQWLVTGRVTDKKGNALVGLTVSLYDKDLLFDDYLGTTKTGENGDFKFIYQKEGFKDLFEAQPDIYIKVFDKEGKTIYSSKKSVKCNVGRTEVFNIKVRIKTKK